MVVSVQAPDAGAALTPAPPAGSPGNSPVATPHERPAGAAATVASVLHPFLLAIFPTLNVVTRTVGTYTMGDLATILGAILGATAVGVAICVLAMRALRRDEPLARGALLASLGVALMFYYIPTQMALGAFAGPLARSAVFLPVCLLLSAVLLWRVVRRPFKPGAVGKILTIAGALLVTSAAVRVTQANAGSRARVERSAVWKAMHAPVAVNPALAAPGPKRDIYLIVLDGYPNAAVLRERFGYDNSAFLDSLRALGFTVPRALRANYVATVLSLSSILNFEHDTLMARDLPPNSVDNTIAITLIRENRVVHFLKERGYRFLLYPTEWSEFTRNSPDADYVYPGPPRRSIRAEMMRSELRRVVFESTLLSKFRAARGGYGGRFVLDEFQQLRSVPQRQEPTFTLAHFMLPHQPIVLDGRCNPVNSDRQVIGERLGMPGPRDVFLGAIRCGNAQVLALVADLLRRSTTPPIIMVIGDHGTLSRGWAVDAKLPTDSIAAERLAPLGAFYMPGGGDALFADSVTHVNLFRRVLRHYFGAELPDASNEAFFNQAGEAYRFRPVDERAVIGGGG